LRLEAIGFHRRDAEDTEEAQSSRRKLKNRKKLQEKNVVLVRAGGVAGGIGD
jgi:hypothetical protein